jgi:hypothetical protein
MFTPDYIKKCMKMVFENLNRNLSGTGFSVEITQHCLDRLHERLESDQDLSNTIVLIKKSINEYLCQILFSFHIPYQNVWVFHKDLKIVWTFNEKTNKITLRTFVKNFSSGDECALSRYTIFME